MDRRSPTAAPPAALVLLLFLAVVAGQAAGPAPRAPAAWPAASLR
ncbi:M23 family peptidase, partial [Streptomyces somaliensis DSM 40738]|nr:M23 family peptidase [Streptomyces somaliensis DSM 40738]